DAVAPLRIGSGFGDVDVVGGGADPDFAALPGSGFFPDADVMALGEGVEGFLEDEVGRSTVNGEQGDGGLSVAGAADRGADGLHGRVHAERVGFKPARLLEGCDEWLLRAGEH